VWVTRTADIVGGVASTPHNVERLPTAIEIASTPLHRSMHLFAGRRVVSLRQLGGKGASAEGDTLVVTETSDVALLGEKRGGFQAWCEEGWRGCWRGRWPRSEGMPWEWAYDGQCWHWTIRWTGLTSEGSEEGGLEVRGCYCANGRSRVAC